MPNVVGLGEILWDILPGGSRHLGGAPMNVSVHAQALGCQGSVISGVGNDELGREAIELLTKKHGLDASAVQVLDQRPTGAVDVRIQNGQPGYVFRPDVAWDFLEVTELTQAKAREADAIVFGTLAQRNAPSRAAIHALVAHARPDCLRVLDVNLRSPFYSDDVIRRSLELANVLKLNDAELPIVLAAIEMETDSNRPEYFFGKYPQLNVIVITRGEQGSTVFKRDHPSSHTLAAKKIVLKDTVGAGDAFTAALIAGLLRGKALESLHEHAVEVAAYVCSQAGATPRIPAKMACI